MPEPTPPPPGFHMPAEGAPHERTLVAWPTERRRAALWHDALDDARTAYAAVVGALAEREAVTLVVDPSDAADASRRWGHGVEVLPLPIDDSWVRDTGPIVVVGDGGERRATAFRFNGWGGKFEPWGQDAALGPALAAHLGLPCHQAPFVLEGGSIAVDGSGLLVTTERCLLNPNRNPGWPREDIEDALRLWLGADQVVWLPDGLAEDEGTDGHVDNVVAFVGEGIAVLQGCSEPGNPNRASAAANRVILESAGLVVVEVPDLPYASVAGQLVPVPYVNFYLANGAVIVPVTGHPGDGAALALLADVTGREVVGVNGTVLAYGGGGVHCITQQVPVAPADGAPAGSRRLTDPAGGSRG